MPSLQTLLMPALSQHLLSEERLQARRDRAEKARRARSERHVVHYFHQVDDPYSALASSCLQQLAADYDITLQAHVVGPPSDNAAPERARLVAYSRKDAALLARRFGLDFRDTDTQPADAATDLATRMLVGAAAQGRFVQVAGAVSAALWRGSLSRDAGPWPGGPWSPADSAACAAHCAAADALRQRLGHYLGAMFFYAGEWYWGIDRLYHLELRLRALGAHKAGARGCMFPPSADLQEPMPTAARTPIEFFASLRSPYTAIVAPRVFTLGRLAGVPVQVRYLLPMVMRGLPVPAAKRRYISLDAAREARVRGIAFGRLNDPVGKPTERGLALMPLAEREGRTEDYLLSFLQGVWAEGIDAGSDRGLRRITERAGLSWAAARESLRDAGWRAVAEANRAAMGALGLWGVPSFRVGALAVWGQDRLWAVQDALMADAHSREVAP